MHVSNKAIVRNATLTVDHYQQSLVFKVLSIHAAHGTLIARARPCFETPHDSAQGPAHTETRTFPGETPDEEEMERLNLQTDRQANTKYQGRVVGISECDCWHDVKDGQRTFGKKPNGHKTVVGC